MKNSKVKITIIADNSVCSNKLIAEHGFSAFIEIDNRKILFDTAQKSILNNSKVLDIDLSQIDTLILSHGHYDHTGGISLLASNNDHFFVYAHKHVLKRRYTRKNGEIKDISIPEKDKSIIANFDQEKVHLFEASCEIINNMYLLSNIPFLNGRDTGGEFFEDSQASIIDNIEDEISICFKTAKGLVILTGCCHRGFINTCEYAKKISGINNIFSVIGGLHLNAASDEKIGEICKYIQSENISKVNTFHCTGDAATDKLNQYLGSIVQKGCAGNVFEYEQL